MKRHSVLNGRKNISYVAYTWLPEHPRAARLETLLMRLPAAVREESVRYARLEDRFRFACGRLLLVKLMTEKYHYTQEAILDHLEYTRQGRPFIAGCDDFNISHSGRLVACAMGCAKIGIDVEWIRPIALYEVESALTAAQRQSIKQSSDPTREFYMIWTMKESLLKAMGTGLLSDPALIDFALTEFDDGVEKFFFHRLFMDPLYACCLATNDGETNIILKKISY